MKPATRARALQIFQSAVELDLEARPEFVRQLCGEDEELSRAVRALLEADSGESLGLERGVGVSLASLAPATAMPEQFGKYRIESELGRGGMGAVYLAWQAEPRRKVAIKTMTGLDSEAARRRFRFEGEVLGTLRHPGIAQVLETGTQQVEEGTLPFIAMEFIEGAHGLLDYVAASNLDLEERIELFLQVAEAVAHAHKSGVIHRDLKPSNLLVDNSGKAKVIDFGLARATTDQGPRPERTLTSPGQLLGTLHYMSPELLRSKGTATVQSDVYSLGVVLFQLLSGEYPHDLEGLSPAEVVLELAEQRPLRLREVGRQLPVELEWICERALEAEPERRYGSVGELADDLRRHQSAHPVEAGPQSRTYLLGKFVRRHRLGFGIGAAFLVGLIGFARQNWKSNQLLAERNTILERANESSNFLRSALQSVTPTGQLGREVSMLDFLDEVERELNESPPNSAEAEAEVHWLLAEALIGLQQGERAYAHVERHAELMRAARGPDARVVLEDEHTMLDIISGGRELEAGSERVADLVRRTERVLGVRDPLSSEVRVLAVQFAIKQMELDGAVEQLLAERSLAIELGDAGLDRIATRSLAQAYLSTGAFAEAELAYAGLCERWPADDAVQRIYDEGNRAAILFRAGRAEEGIEISRRNCEEIRAVHGGVPVLYARGATLAYYLIQAGETDEARELLSEVASGVPECASQPGMDRLILTAAATQAARCYLSLDELELANQLAERAHGLCLAERLESWQSLDFMVEKTLADARAKAGRYAEARVLLERAMAEWTEQGYDSEGRQMQQMRYALNQLPDTGDASAGGD